MSSGARSLMDGTTIRVLGVPGRLLGISPPKTLAWSMAFLSADSLEYRVTLSDMLLWAAARIGDGPVVPSGRLLATGWCAEFM
jgi:hypothetical protein